MFNQEEPILTSIPVAQPIPAAIGTTIIPTPVSDNVMEAAEVDIINTPSVELIKLFISL